MFTLRYSETGGNVPRFSPEPNFEQVVNFGRMLNANARPITALLLHLRRVILYPCVGGFDLYCGLRPPIQLGKFCTRTFSVRHKYCRLGTPETGSKIPENAGTRGAAE